MLFIDGAYELGPKGEPGDFIASPPPTVAEINEVLSQIIKRLTRYLERHKIIIKDDDSAFQLNIAEEDSFSKLQASSVTYRFALGPGKGKKAMVLKSVPDGDHNSKRGLVAKNSGFSLHAGVAIKADDREGLERVCRYIARPAISEERLSLNARGEVVYRLKAPWDDGTTAIKLTQMQLLERLAALVPRPRVHLTRFHGVLAPNYKYRKQIVPAVKAESAVAESAIDADSSEKTSTKRIPWARLLKRVFGIDISVCSRCKGRVRVIAAIEDPKIIKKILEHMGLPSTPPRFEPARGPPVSDQGDMFAQEFFET